MNKRTYIAVTSVIFLVVAVVHLYRALTGMEVRLGADNIPLAASWVGFIVAGFLAYTGLRLRK